MAVRSDVAEIFRHVAPGERAHAFSGDPGLICSH